MERNERVVNSKNEITAPKRSRSRARTRVGARTGRGRKKEDPLQAYRSGVKEMGEKIAKSAMEGKANLLSVKMSLWEALRIVEGEMKAGER